MNFEYDFFVIGGGSGGVRAARFASGQYKARVALAEEREMGGTCVNVGCIPKKLMSIAAHVHEEVEDAAGFGWTIATPTHNWAALIAAKDKEIARLNGAYQRTLENAGVKIFPSRAVIEGPNLIKVGDQQITAHHILIATGGWPVKADVPGAEHAITSNEFFHLSDMPKRCVIFGGGYVAVEFASVLAGLGSKVTLIYRGARVLKDFDGELGDTLGREMIKKHIDLRLNTTIERISKAGALLTVATNTGDKVETDCVIFATGRAPHSGGLGLENVGVQCAANGAIKVDEHYQTNVPSIHAIGDVIDRVLLTPVALAEGMVLADRLFGKGVRTMSYDNIATAIFSHPNVGTVGLSEETARARGHRLRIYRSTFKPLKHTLSGRDEKTFMKLVVDDPSDRVLGVHMVGPDAGELIQGFAVALNCGATKAQFDSTIGIHPTSAEEFVTMREVSST